MAVYFAFLKPGDKMLTMTVARRPPDHGNKANFSGKFFEIVHYGVRRRTSELTMTSWRRWRESIAKMITVGQRYPRTIDFECSGRSPGASAYLLADIAHIAGLVATGLHRARAACRFRNDYHAQDAPRTTRGCPVQGEIRQGN